MENNRRNLPQNQPKREVSSTPSLTKVETRVAKLIQDINMLVPFPLEASDIIRWAQDLARLLPMEELTKLPFLMDQFKLETVIWDKTLGIQNIIRGLRCIEHTETGFKVNKPIY